MLTQELKKLGQKQLTSRDEQTCSNIKLSTRSINKCKPRMEEGVLGNCKGKPKGLTAKKIKGKL